VEDAPAGRALIEKDPLPVWEMLALFLAGLSLFFTGLAGVKSQAQLLSGRRLRRLLAFYTGNPAMATILGILAGAISQSASAVAFIMSSMIHTGLLPKRRALLVVAASNIGTAVLVFMASIDLHLAILYVIGIAGIAINFKIVPRLSALFGVLFAIALLFFGLELMKTGFAPLPKMPGFIAFAAFLQSWDMAALLLGMACRMLIQSSSAIGVIALALQTAGVFTELQAMLVICGCGPGVALSGLFLAGNVRGASRQILLFQGLLNCLAGVSLGLLLIVDNALGLIGIMDWMGQQMSDPAARIAVVYLANMALAWLFGVLSLPFIEEILNRIEPPTQSEDIARPAYIHDEAVQVPETATILADREMRRFLDLQIQLLDCVRSERNPDSYDDPRALHDGMIRLQPEIRDFLAELVNQQLDRETSLDVLRLERRLDQLETLEASIYALTKVYSSVSSAGRANEIMTSLLESASLMLLTLADVWTYRDPTETDMLLKMTTDRGELMERVRLTYRSGSTAELESDSAVFYATTLFERIIWLCRQIAQSLDVEKSAVSA
jgi:phosphate:Na+ symporter